MSTAPVHPLATELPSFGLVLRTPRLALRPVWDEDIAGLVDAAVAGIHPQDEMPFVVPWSLAPREEMLPSTAKNIWGERAERTPDEWNLSFAVRRVDADVEAWWEAPIIGRQDYFVKNFPLNRSVGTGSWLTAAQQGQGLGKEMRQAVLAFAFDHLGATEATSGAYDWNRPSQGVSRSVGYRENGVVRDVSAGKAARTLQFAMEPHEFKRPEWTLSVEGDLPGLRAELGIPEA
ncbi:MAG: GNAT family N-acetyltransferase [Arthrobacter sp.]|jgi:RimJ/RimL family protein N-acetyltransferase|nr:GNAT family N-acetyltransferase [Arthrobacter sp.]